MWMTIVILCGTLVGLVAMLALGFQATEQERERAAADPGAAVPTVKQGHCMLCDALLRRPSTRDEVVLAVEHRIHADLQEISTVLETAPESFGRLYQARA
jgi:hypothetical protein